MFLQEGRDIVGHDFAVRVYSLCKISGEIDLQVQLIDQACTQTVAADDTNVFHHYNDVTWALWRETVGYQ